MNLLTMGPLLLYLILGLLPLTPSTAFAEGEKSCVEQVGKDYEARLFNYWTSNCYVNEKTYRHLSATLKQELVPTGNYLKRTEVTLGAINTARQESTRLTSDLADAIQAINSALQEQAATSFTVLNDLPDKSSKISNLANWSRATWTPNQPGNQTWEAVKTTLKENNCLAVPQSRDCDRTYADALAASGLLFAMRDITAYYLQPATDMRLNEYRLNVARWDDYLTAMQFQYPWELLLNYCYDNPRYVQKYGDEANGKNQAIPRWKCFVPIWGTLVARKHLHNKPDIGFVSPPNRRWIFLHPEVSAIYAGDQSSGDKYSLALNFEWIGRYFYRYDNTTGRIKNPVGLSIVSTIADLPGSNNHGLGLMVHYRNLGLSVTRHSGDTVIGLNLNLLKAFEDLESNTVGKLKGKFERLTDDNL